MMFNLVFMFDLCHLLYLIKQFFRSCQANPHNYDAWFDYLRLVENDADADTVREVYERAIANMPPIQEKRHWKRYIYLWINYALYEELEVKVGSLASERRHHHFTQKDQLERNRVYLYDKELL